MRTTIELPDALFREVKSRAAQQGVTLKDLVTHFIEAGIRGGASVAAPPSRRREPLPAAIPREPDKPLTPALTNRELAAILEQDDVARYRRGIEPSSRP